MKKVIVTTFLLLIFNFILAQAVWQQDGIPVRQGVNIEWSRAAASVEDGGVVYTWSDTRLGDRDVWAQKIDSEGNELWGENGTLINDQINRQEDIVVIDVGNNEVVVAWVDFRNEDAGDIYAQKLDSAGNIMWAEAGVPLCLAANIQISLNIVSDDAGGAYVLWIDKRASNTDIYATHILSSGNIADGWEVDGNAVVVMNGDQNQHSFRKDGTGKAVVVWHDKRDAEDEDLYMQRLGENGQMMWGENGILLCGEPGAQESTKLIQMEDTGMVVVWRDKRNDNDGDIYARKVNLDGSFAWSNEVVIYEGSGIQRNPRLASGSDNSVLAVWEDGRNDSYYKDIFAQKIAADGNLNWDSNGKAVCVEANDQLNPRLTADANGGAWLIWDDGRQFGHPQEDIYIQHLSNSGEELLTANGQVVCDAANQQFSPLLRRSGENIFAYWGDNRESSTGMYLQIYDSAGNAQLAENGKLIYYGLCGDAINFQFLENGSNPVIVWEDTRNAISANQIYMQVLTENGEFNLAENGEPVTEMTGADQENMDAVINSAGTEIAIVWEENRSDFKQIYAQAVDSQNNSLWNLQGVHLGENLIAQQELPKISYKQAEDAYYTGWADFRNFEFAIFGQKIQNNVKQWDNSGKLIADRDGNDKLNDIVQNYYIWQSGSYNELDIYMLKVDENGDPVENWPTDGLEICTASGKQKNARGILVPQGVLVVWEDQRDDNLDIYGQLVSAEGESLWQPDGEPLVALANDQLISDAIFEDYLYLVWEDFRNGEYKDVYVQKYNLNGEQLLAEDGVAISSVTSNQTNPVISHNQNNFLVTWEDYRNVGGCDIYTQLLDAFAVPYWNETGEQVCGAIKAQDKPQSVSDSDNNVFVIWQDKRSSGKTDIYNIYAQKFEIDDTSNSTEVISPSQLRNYPNPFNPETTISFELPNNMLPAKLEVYNIRGRKITAYEIQPGQNHVIWNGTSSEGNKVASGVYFYKLKQLGKTISTQKMLLVK